MKKKKLLLVMMLLLPVVGFAQSNQSKLDSICDEVKQIAQMVAKTQVDKAFDNKFKLYSTQNMYTFLQLDTSNGKIQQVQWNLDSDKEFSISLNDIDLTYGINIGSWSERFELYPTQNMYQFILLDKVSGAKWHVQWGMEASKRWIRPIN